MLFWIHIAILTSGVVFFLLTYGKFNKYLEFFLIGCAVIFISSGLYERGRGEHAIDNWKKPILRGVVYKNVATVRYNDKNLVLIYLPNKKPEYFSVEWIPPEVGKCFVVIDADEETHALETEC